MTENIQILRYMGNKRAILDYLEAKVNHSGFLPRGSTILDLFAGTHSVGYRFKKNYRILANDVQLYSNCIGKAIIENNTVATFTDTDLHSLAQHYSHNLLRLKKMTHSIRRLPYSENCPKNHPVTKTYQKNNKKTPYALFSYYFADKYFSFENCLKIDSLRFAIDQSFPSTKDPRRFMALSALLYTISYSVNNSGHFAEYKTHGADIKDAKTKDAHALFMHKAHAIKIESSSFDNKCFNYEYSELLANTAKLKEVDLIYADPPYTSAEYSRFYHVPETLIKYDYPKVSGKGLYRPLSERFRSNFSKPPKARSELKKLIELVTKLNPKIKLAVSYSDHGIIPIQKIKTLCKKKFNMVTIHSSEYFYSKKYSYNGQGARNSALKKDKKSIEYLFLCEDAI